MKWNGELQGKERFRPTSDSNSLQDKGVRKDTLRFKPHGHEDDRRQNVKNVGALGDTT